MCHRDQRNWSNSQERHNCQKEQKKNIPSKTTPFSHFRQKQKKSSQLFRSLRSRPPTRTRFTGLGKYTTNGQLNVSQCSFGTTRLKKKNVFKVYLLVKVPNRALFRRIVIAHHQFYTLSIYFSCKVCQNGEIGKVHRGSQSNEKFRW